MGTTDGAMWPLASSPERARWAAQAVERYLHMARIIMTRAAASPAVEARLPALALDLTHLYTRRKVHDRTIVPARTGS